MRLREPAIYSRVFRGQLDSGREEADDEERVASRVTAGRRRDQDRLPGIFAACMVSSNRGAKSRARDNGRPAAGVGPGRQVLELSWSFQHARSHVRSQHHASQGHQVGAAAPARAGSARARLSESPLAGFLVGLCRTILAQMSEFVEIHLLMCAPRTSRRSTRPRPRWSTDHP